MVNLDTDKVKKYWDSEVLVNKYKDNEVISKISSLKQKCISKVENEEWTIEDYKNFVKFINTLKLYRFSNFYNIVILYLNLPEKECYLEIKSLCESGLIKPEIKSDSFSELLARTTYEFEAQFRKLASIKLTLSQKNGFDSIQDKLDFYEDLLSEVRNNHESDYNKLLLATYNQFIETYVKNSELKKQFINMNNIIIDYKIKNLMFIINNTKRNMERKKIYDYNSLHHEVVNKRLIKKYRMRKDKRK